MKWRRSVVSIRVSNTVVVLALIVLAACRIEPTPRGDPDAPASIVRAEIELTLRNYQEAMIEGDARRVAAVFTPGAHVYLPGAAALTGRGEIDRALSDRFADERIIDMVMEFDRIDVGTGFAHQFGTLHQRIRSADGEEREIDGRFAMRWVRAADSAWRIDRLLVHHSPSDSGAVARQ
jgi:uncharacterized protein (TIGR02246 family)